MIQHNVAAVMGDSLMAESETLSPQDAVAIARSEYGFEVTARALSGERDSNFNLRRDDGTEYLLKVAHSAEDAGIFRMQTEALGHAARRDPALPLQRVIPTRTGSAQAGISGYGRGQRAVRLVSYVGGILQRKTTATPAQRFNVGAASARLQNALADFRHPAAAYDTIWDLKNASRLRALLGAVRDDRERAELASVVDLFDVKVAPAIPDLRTQILHNDLNSDNVLVDADDPSKVAGIIDFGDMVETAIVVDAAVGAAYQLAFDEDPLDGALQFLSGFVSARPLLAGEIDILFDLILTRQALRILITEARAARFPENREYILRNTPTSRAQLAHLRRLAPGEARARIRNACQTGEA